MNLQCNGHNQLTWREEKTHSSLIRTFGCGTLNQYRNMRKNIVLVTILRFLMDKNKNKSKNRWAKQTAWVSILPYWKHVPEVTGNGPPGPGQESIPQKNHLRQVSGDFTVLSYRAITEQVGTGKTYLVYLKNLRKNWRLSCLQDVTRNKPNNCKINKIKKIEKDYNQFLKIIR